MENIKADLIKRVEQHLIANPIIHEGTTHENRLDTFRGDCVRILNDILTERKFDASRKDEIISFITPTILSLATTHLGR